MSNEIPIIMYHRIDGVQTRNLYQGYIDAQIVIPEKDFYFQIEKITSYYSVIPLEKLVENLTNLSVLPKNPCVLTFDDGFHEMHSIVFPILKKFNITATFFVSGDHIAGTNQVRWLDLYYYLVNEISERNTSNSIIRNIHPDLQESNDVNIALKQILRKLPLEEKYQLLLKIENELELQVDIQLLNKSLYLSLNQIKEMSKSGMFFGAHSMTHQVMANLDSDTALYEVRESLQKIRKITRQNNIAFAYPFGGRNSYTAEVVRMVRENGGMCGCTTIPEMNTSDTSIFELNRIPAEKFLI
ncbi:MAG: polysaccharide deacetylase family protein [Candidatus Paceibacterota bacterium]